MLAFDESPTHPRGTLPGARGTAPRPTCPPEDLVPHRPTADARTLDVDAAARAAEH
ncbi:MAG: hypothetical protein JWO60_401, partial [Frankiales bacterium]|nr:hypothetical protein [Frankiales bacterium]